MTTSATTATMWTIATRVSVATVAIVATEVTVASENPQCSAYERTVACAEPAIRH